MMRTKAETMRVLPGQTWLDCDPRMNGRKVEVVSVGDKYAHCQVVGSARPVRILVDRMRPTAHGYRLVL